MLNTRLQRELLDLFDHKRSNELPIAIHSQIDSLKSGMVHGKHCDKEPKNLTIVFYL